MEASPTNAELRRAAQYVRMSTEHQQYSTENQSAAIAQYASARGIQIVRSFVDAGKSGLKLAGRDALQELLRTVEAGRPDFDCILVYDISRWGRFQDADEGAYYEYICKRAGITVYYCAEQFQNDDSATSSLLKSLKRTMAGEYSRELSNKVFAGHRRLVELGFRQGSFPGYGLRRQLIDRTGARKGVLNEGEWKNLQTDRIVLVPGPPEELAIVKEIYDLFTSGAKTPREIAEVLNKRGVAHHKGSKWSANAIRHLLTNPKYIGANVWNRCSFKLKKSRVVNSQEQWIWNDAAFEPIVPREQFVRARAILREHRRQYGDEEMLAMLRSLLARKGKLSGPLINEMDDMPSRSAYSRHFGGVLQAFKLIGYKPPQDYSFFTTIRRIREVYRREWNTLIKQLQEAGVKIDHEPLGPCLVINGEYTASLILVRCRATHCTFRWPVNLSNSDLPDIIIVGRMAAANRAVMDYYVVPCLDLPKSRLVLKPDNAMNLEVHRFQKLTTFIDLARRARVREVA